MKLRELFEKYFGEPATDCAALSGTGASARKYWRIKGESGRTAIGVTGTNVQENRAFIEMSRSFSAAGIAVPLVYAVSEDGMEYLQEDLGDTVLFDCIDKIRSESGDAELMKYGVLRRTVRALADLQFMGGKVLDFEVCYPVKEFGPRQIDFDLNYFKYCFLKATGLNFDEQKLQDDFESLKFRLLDCEYMGFLMRDCQARNVMIKDEKPYFIDFQGGHRGPVYYDLASFLWQARAEYPSGLKAELLDEYLDAAKHYVKIDRAAFQEKLQYFVLFRTLQVLGCYGFRGYYEQKSFFAGSVPYAMANVRELLSDGPAEQYPAVSGNCTEKHGNPLWECCPYICELLDKLAMDKRYAVFPQNHGRLIVEVSSFSYRKGIPHDYSNNGGGYVFDCRSIHNPGRYEPYKAYTGMDSCVQKFLEDDGEVMEFLQNVYGLVDRHVETYLCRSFGNLRVDFGCTGGQHRSVYCAEHLAAHIAEKFPAATVHLLHREQNVEKYFNEHLWCQAGNPYEQLVKQLSVSDRHIQ